MKKLLNVFSEPKELFAKTARWFMIITALFAFTANAAMGMDAAVTHHSFGLAVFIIGVSLTFIWVVDAALKGLIKPYKELRGEESVNFGVSIAYTVLGFTAFILTIVTLAIH